MTFQQLSLIEQAQVKTILTTHPLATIVVPSSTSLQAFHIPRHFIDDAAWCLQTMSRLSDQMEAERTEAWAVTGLQSENTPHAHAMANWIVTAGVNL